eukprot:5890798-Pyramimonas_sp.AAC.1
MERDKIAKRRSTPPGVAPLVGTGTTCEITPKRFLCYNIRPDLQGFKRLLAPTREFSKALSSPPAANTATPT